MTLRPGRRTAALATGLGLAAGSLLVAPVAPASAAAPENDSVAAVAGGQWLAREVGEDGLLENPQFPDFFDYGLTVDAGFTFASFEGGQLDGRLSDVTSALSTEESVQGYLGFGDPNETVAGAAGKLMSFLQSQGVDVSDVDGVDLEARTAETVSTDSTIAGRIENISEFGDNANVLGQGFVARALTIADNPQAGPATDFLLEQQCSEGYFRNFFSAKADADQSCDGASADESVASVDATALSMINLQATDPAAGSPVAEALDAGTEWLLGQQTDDGSFLGAPPTDTPNTNSTGLAATALAGQGEEDAAEDAAEFVSGLQAQTCDGPLAEEAGAVAYEQASYDAGRTDGIPVELVDQWRRASAQAVIALRSLDAATGSLARTDSARFVKAGSTVRLRVSDLADGSHACLTGPGTEKRLGGDENRVVSVGLPGGTGNRTYRLSSRFERVDSLTLRALAAAKLGARATKQRAARGEQQVIRVTGLVSGENARVKVRGKKVASGRANENGVFRASFRVTGAKGRAAVQAIGQFGNRTGTTTFVVR